VGANGERWERAINGGLWAEPPPPAELGGEALPAEAESILTTLSANGAQIWPFLLPCKLLKYVFLNKILLHLAVSLHTSDSSHDLVLSPVE